MFQSLGVEFEKDELISSRGGDVVTRGDAHLGKLASACELQLQRLLARRSGGNLPESVGGEHSPTAMSAAEWARKMASVSLTYSEVLQLQQNIPEAIDVVSKLRDELRANPLHRRHHMQCLRRLGVLHKVSGRLADAEASVREYIALCGDSDTGNGGGDGDAHGSDALANAYTLLATIIDEAGGRPHEALAADKVAMEIMKKGRPCM